MSYRVRFTLPNGATGVLALTHPTREEALRLILERQEETGLAYVVEEVVATAAVPDATPNPTASQWPGFPARQEARAKVEVGCAMTPHEAQSAIRSHLQMNHADRLQRENATLRETLENERNFWAASRQSHAALKAELAQLRDAYDAAVQDRDVALRKVETLKTTAAMLEADLFTARQTAKVAWASSEQASCKTVVFMVRLDHAIELGDAMHRAHPSEEWAAFKDSLAASRQVQGPSNASEWAGGTAHTGPGHQPGAGQGVASRLIVDLDAIERDCPAKASKAPGEGGDSGEGGRNEPYQ